jgi:acyl dehydratase
VRGRWFDDIEVGERLELGSFHFSAEEVVDFASRYDPQPFHLDPEAGARSYLGGFCASGWQTCAAFMKCCAASDQAGRAERAAQGHALPPLGPSPGFEDLKWLRPVYVDDSVAYAMTVAAKRELASRPQWGLVLFDNEGVNQKGEKVMSFTGKLLVARKA